MEEIKLLELKLNEIPDIGSDNVKYEPAEPSKKTMQSIFF